MELIKLTYDSLEQVLVVVRYRLKKWLKDRID